MSQISPPPGQVPDLLAPAAVALGLDKSAASNRYTRALERLKEFLASLPGGIEEFRP